MIEIYGDRFADPPSSLLCRLRRRAVRSDDSSPAVRRWDVAGPSRRLLY